MGDFTGKYYVCSRCKHVYDFKKSCPCCGSNIISEISSDEVKDEVFRIRSETNRIIDMLNSHGDWIK